MIKDYVEQILILTYRSAAGEVEQVLSLPRAEEYGGRHRVRDHSVY